MITLYNADNIEVMGELIQQGKKFDLIYADCMYELLDFPYIYLAKELLTDTGVYIHQTDYHSLAEVWIELNKLYGKDHFVNHLIYLNEWGGTPKNRFAQKSDDILVFAKGKEWYFDSSKIQIPKKTAGTAFDKKGTGMKTPCNVFYDKLSFSTMSKERVILGGKGAEMQKPEWLMERLLLAYSPERSKILDIFSGVGTTLAVCQRLNRDCVGIEKDTQRVDAIKQRVILTEQRSCL